jgi:hypothetical protein
MMQHTGEFKISSPQDIETFKNSLGKTEKVHLNLKDSKLDNKQFVDVFNKLAESKKNEFHLDLSNTEIDDTKMNSFVKCFESWDNLKNLKMNLSKVKFSEDQFNKMFDSIQNMKNLEKIQLNLKNVDMTKKMRDRLENLFKNLPSVKELAINTKSSNITEDDVRRINEMIRSFPRFVHFHDFPSLYPSHFCNFHGHDEWPMLI